MVERFADANYNPDDLLGDVRGLNLIAVIDYKAGNLASFDQSSQYAASLY